MTIIRYFAGSFVGYLLNMVLLLHLYTLSRLVRSPSKLQLQVPPSILKTYEDHSFSVCAPKLWNCLLDFIRCSPNVSSFKSSLKIYLFKGYFLCNVSSIILFFFFFFSFYFLLFFFFFFFFFFYYKGLYK